MKFNGKRLSLARRRRQLTAKSLAEAAGLNKATIVRLEQSQHQPDDETLTKLSEVLGYNKSFFYGQIDFELTTNEASFRSLKAMTARERDAALSAGELGMQVYKWMCDRFDLPKSNVPDFRVGQEHSPETAARLVRQAWGIGDRPIPALLKLLEAKGIRIFGLEESTSNVDAFSFWDNNSPFIFLNTFKSAERSLFDAAHELGHLVLHRHGISDDARTAENEANAFASAFLMPKADILATMPRYSSVNGILRMKKRWRVSAMALAYRLRTLGLLSEWQHRSVCIELGKLGYRSAEPGGIEREGSTLWPMVFRDLWSRRLSKDDITNELGLPMDELEALLSGLMRSGVVPAEENSSRKGLTVVS